MLHIKTTTFQNGTIAPALRTRATRWSLFWFLDDGVHRRWSSPKVCIQDVAHRSVSSVTIISESLLVNMGVVVLSRHGPFRCGCWFCLCVVCSSSWSLKWFSTRCRRFCHSSFRNFGFILMNSYSVTVPTLLVVVERFVAAAPLSSSSVSSFSVDWYFGAFEGKSSFASTSSVLNVQKRTLTCTPLCSLVFPWPCNVDLVDSFLCVGFGFA